MFDPKKLLDDLLGSKIPARSPPYATRPARPPNSPRTIRSPPARLVAVLLGTGTGRQVTGSALKIGGLAAVAGLAYKAYQNYQKGNQPGASSEPGAQQDPVLCLPPTPSPILPRRRRASRVHARSGAGHDRSGQGRRPYRRRGEEEDRRPPGARRPGFRGRGLPA